MGPMYIETPFTLTLLDGTTFPLISKVNDFFFQIYATGNRNGSFICVEAYKPLLHTTIFNCNSMIYCRVKLMYVCFPFKYC